MNNIETILGKKPFNKHMDKHFIKNYSFTTSWEDYPNIEIWSGKDWIRIDVKKIRYNKLSRKAEEIQYDLSRATNYSIKSKKFELKERKFDFEDKDECKEHYIQFYEGEKALLDQRDCPIIIRQRRKEISRNTDHYVSTNYLEKTTIHPLDKHNLQQFLSQQNINLKLEKRILKETKKIQKEIPLQNKYGRARFAREEMMFK